MSKHDVIGQLGSLLAILALGSACGAGEIGDAEGAARLGADDGNADAASSSFEPGNSIASACSGAIPDVSASDGWLSSKASLPAVGTLYFETEARPMAANLDGLMAVGAEDINDFAKAAITVRFADDGLVDVRDGDVYSSDVSYAYDPGVWYTIAISADIPTETYDVEIGRCGEPRETLIEGASFRYGANVSDQLSTWAVWSSQAAALEVSTPTWKASGGCAPATCQSLGTECGARSNGCGGTLDCGGCGARQTCSSNVCIDQPVTPPPPGGDPDRPWADNTGPSNPSALVASGSLSITTDGAVYENLDISGDIWINASNVTIRNFRINGGFGFYGINIAAGNRDIVIEDGEIFNTGNGIRGLGYTARRLHIHDNNDDGFRPEGVAGSGPTLIEYCFVEKMGLSAGAHADALQVSGVSEGSYDVTLQYNNFYMPAPGTPAHPGDASKASAVIFLAKPVSNYLVQNNWMDGGGYTVYCGGNTGDVLWRNNIFGTNYDFGPVTGTCQNWSGNVWEDTGAPVPPN